MNINTVLYDGDCQFCKKWVHFSQSKLKDKTIAMLQVEIERLKEQSRKKREK